MELPQPHRLFGTEGKSPTHDFLSLYNDPSFRHHQDPRPPSQGFYVKTRDFLEPLERVGDSNGKGEGVGEISTVEKSASSVEHVLPGGIGTYSISHISSFGQPVVKPETERKVEGDCNNRTSYGGGAFTLWEESLVKDKGLVVKDTVGERQTTIRGNVVEGRWSSERHSQPFISRSSFSPISSSMQPVQKNQGQGFMDMIKCVKGTLTEEDEDEEEEYVNKKEVSSHKGDSSGKLDGKSNDQRANTPRSKHSATEQRRRSKINDRFQILRELIPHNDQKRDKASFLLEVIEYIQLLQEKVNKYEASYQGWNQEIQENVKLPPWKNSQETMADHPRDTKNGPGPGPGFMFAGKFDNNSIAGTTPSMPTSSQNPAESEHMSTGVPFRTMDHNPALANKAIAVPLSLHQNMYPFSIGRGSGFAQPQQRLMSDAENMASHPPSQLWQRFGSNDCCVNSSILNQREELTIEGGTISISSVYSQGLLSTLTQALQSSGVDLSQASISVQIDLGKRANTRPSATTTSSAKDHEDPSCSNQAMAHSRVASSAEDSEQSKKRLRTENS